jgi:hypothetical protein
MVALGTTVRRGRCQGHARPNSHEENALRSTPPVPLSRDRSFRFLVLPLVGCGWWGGGGEEVSFNAVQYFVDNSRYCYCMLNDVGR